MTLDRLGRWRLPAIAVAAFAIALAVVAAILLLPSLLGTPDNSPRPTTTEQPSATEAVGDTPEAAVRAFFEAFAEAREKKPIRRSSSRSSTAPIRPHT